MPIHDWTRVPSGLFHHFHQDWSIEIARTLNRGVLTHGYSAFAEQRVDGPEGDVITVGTRTKTDSSSTTTLEPPKTKLVTRTSSEASKYARKANRISIQHPLGNVVAVIEIVSPGNKDSRHAIRSLVDKAASFLRNGIHMLIVDLFPPSDRDPQGIHKAIWDEFKDELFTLEADKQLTLVSYQAGEDVTAYVEPVGIGDVLPDMALFLAPDLHVYVPLEATYQTAWSACPASLRELLVPPKSE
jgi:hypothetical protein